MVLSLLLIISLLWPLFVRVDNIYFEFGGLVVSFREEMFTRVTLYEPRH